MLNEKNIISLSISSYYRGNQILWCLMRFNFTIHSAVTKTNKSVTQFQIPVSWLGLLAVWIRFYMFQSNFTFFHKKWHFSFACFWQWSVMPMVRAFSLWTLWLFLYMFSNQVDIQQLSVLENILYNGIWVCVRVRRWVKSRLK